MSVEVGVVDSDEISQRLIGGVGRAHPPRDALSHRILPDDLPGVALYIEANRTVDIPEGLGASVFGTFLLERWREAADDYDEVAAHLLDQAPIRWAVRTEGRSEERGVGKERVSKCSYRWAPLNSQKTNKTLNH